MNISQNLMQKKTISDKCFDLVCFSFVIMKKQVFNLKSNELNKKFE
jgi:hypothetical protein